MPDANQAKLDSRGLLLAFLAYLLWGAFPLYFHLLSAADPVEIIGHRLVWTNVFCLAGVLVWREWTHLRAVVADRKLFWRLTLAGVLVSANWLIYVWGVLNNHIVDAALGYFINPLFTVALAVFVLGEKLRRAQLVAVAIGILAVVVIAVGYGQIPWVALSLAVTFGIYGLVKKQVGGRVSPLVGLTVETTMLAPVALAYLVWLQASGHGAYLAHGPGLTVALTLAGAVTAIPLLMFAAASSRIPLSMMGFIQYLTPVIQFALGVWVNHEEMPLARWLGFGLVWLAVVVLTVDGVRAARRPDIIEPEVVN
ncbi:MAG TPA: EamA family transporter RarD [Propionicimonas sp.]|nr:EamA family transporter RarD [Propionicimonas sp.]HQA77631.1 EamA family transporter RarD [Propionicimonas sp.]HQD97444.1 EamA family transporter RarD [Propionicimonas sp.]